MRSDRRWLGRWSQALGSQALALLVVFALAGCGGAQATSPPVTPAPTLDAAKAALALDRFAGLLKSPTLSMHLEQTSSVVASAASKSSWVGSNYRMDVSGPDFAATVFLAGQTVEFRSVAGIGYVKEGSGAWTMVPLDLATLSEIVNPWQSIGPLAALRPVNWTFNPREAFIYGNSGPIEYQTVAMRAQGITGQITSLRFVVRPDGAPIELTFNGQAAAASGTLTFASTLTATRVGDEIKIDKPVP